MKSVHSDEQEIADRSNNENDVAGSMCLPLMMNDVDIGVALVDQGASRSVMRRTAFDRVKKSMRIIPRLHAVRNMYVVGSTNEYIPVIGCFKADLYTTDKKLVSKTMIHVIADTEDKDIVCDFVLGRSSIATSSYSCIDTQGTGALVATERGVMDRIPCYRCQFVKNADGKSQLMMIADSKSQTAECVSSETRAAKMNMFTVLVNSRIHLSHSAQTQLLDHLIENEHLYDVDDAQMEEEDSHVIDDVATADSIHICHLMSELGKTLPCSEEEKNVISELFAAFVPTVVKKSTTIAQEKSASSLAHSEQSTETSAERDEVDDIEFPLIPPIVQETSDEYKKTKQSAITAMVDGNDHLTHEEKKQLIDLLMKYDDRFSMKGENMQRTDAVQHEIDTGGKRPFRERLRQYAPAVQQIIDNEVQSMLKQGVIVPSKSPYASNLLLVRKPDASSEGGVKNRVCASFVQLNTQTEKDSYPLPNIQYIFDRIGRSAWFTTMDLLSGFWQVMIKPEHRHKTAFITMRGLYEFIVMPFGLCNAPATFQRLMDAVILPEYRAFIETYIDDLMTHSITFSDHLRHLDILLKALRDHKLVVKLSKCKFAQKEVKFLGHVISQNSIKTNPEAVSAIKCWIRPVAGSKKAITAVRSFLGMAGWYRKFIPNFADLARPLFQLTKKDAVFEWTDECQRAFESIRDKLTSSPVLAVADANKSYILHTDASDHAMGAVLMQEDDDGHLHPIAYASKTFNDAQQNYDTTETEALAIIWALQHFNTYCEGHKYTLMTDHQALSFIRTNKDSSKRIHRWQVLLQAYQVDIYYKKGSSNHAADLLSRQLMQIDSSIRVNVLRKATRKKKKRVTFDDDYEVERIVDKRRASNDEHEYLVQWKGYAVEDNSWEPASHLANASQAIADFEKSLQQTAAAAGRDLAAASSPSAAIGDDASASSVTTDRTTTYTAADHEDEARSSRNAGMSSSSSSLLLSSSSSSSSTTTSTIDDGVSVMTTTVACDLCQYVCSNEAALHVHRFHEHSIQVPTDRLKQMPMTANVDAFRLLQQSEAQFRVIFNSDLGQTDVESLSARDRRMMLNNEFIMSESGLLYMIESSSARSRSRVHTQLRLCIPRTERQRLLYQYHDTAAHHGVIHVYDTLREKVWWPRMLSDVVNYVHKCSECQRSKAERNQYLPRPMNVPTGPWTHIAIDHIGPFPTSNNGNKYVLVIVDRFTKYAEAIPCEDDSALTTARILVDHIICRHGFPIVILSDRGPGFTSALLHDVMKMLNIKKIKTTAYHPQSNGGVEIVNKTVKKTLKLWINERHNDWDVLLPYALFSYNTAVHSVAHHSPFYLTYGREPRTVVDQITEDDLRSNNDTHVYAHELATKLCSVHRRVREIYEQINSDRAAAIEEEKAVTYSPGDQVWLYDPTTPKQRSRKLVKRWRGPYTVIRCNSDVTATIMKGDKESLVSVARLRPHRQGVESVEDQHKHDIELAEEEIRVINETIKLMTERKDALDIERSISEVGQQIEQEDAMSGVMVNSMDFVCIW